jgi:putative SOS response-associated peptidase YedK
VATDLFYECKVTPAGKVPYCIRIANGAPFFFAGPWDCWHAGTRGQHPLVHDSDDGAQCDLVAGIRNRTPAIVRPGHHEAWLSLELVDSARVGALIGPYPADAMEATRGAQPL